MHEAVYANTTATVYESDSLGKTITASVVATAVEHGLVDLVRTADVVLPYICVRVRVL